MIGKDSIPIEGELEEQQEKVLLKEKTVANAVQFQEEVDEKGSDYESPATESDPEDRWDAETILTTYTNTDNHPGVIKFVPKVKVGKAKIELHKQFKVPIDGLNGLIPIAEEIEVKKKQKSKGLAKSAFEEDTSSSEGIQEDDKSDNEEKEPEEELNPKKAAKKAMKAERREKRKQKKELKLAFKNQMGKAKGQVTATAGNIGPGISVRKIN